jgi:diguanylate cyclase (GGDEF)-like protein
MALHAFRRSTDFLILKVVAAAFLGLVVLTAGTFGFLVWSTWNIDEVASARQKDMARHVIGRFRYQIAHDQESVTVWDDAISNVRDLPGAEAEEWTNANLGEWMSTYFRHDAAYVLSPGNEPVYAYSRHHQAPVTEYSQIHLTITPMLGALRDGLRRSDVAVEEGLQTFGVADFRILNGRPAVISLKPIVSDSGEIEQVAGQEYVHVAVRYLDGEFLKELESKYDFDSMHFAPVFRDEWRSVGLPLLASGGGVIGYLVWEPYRPGLDFLVSITPALLLILAIAIGAVSIFIVMLSRRIKANRDQEAKIRHLATHDPLTGLLNRAAFEAILDRRLADAGGQANQIAVLYLDLDRFKPINDTLGHQAGDRVICGVGERIKALLPPHSALCRIGGDEFNVLIPYDDVADVERLATAIVEAIQAPFDIDGQTAFVGISVGVAIAPQHGRERTELTRKADVALYSAKASGRGCYSIFGPHMDALVRERAEIERDLRKALSDLSQFKVFYQPKYLAESGEMGSVEALARWQHPTRGMISPVYFVPIAEEAGLIRELGRYVLEQACRDAARWPFETVAVNVSPVQLRDPGFAVDVMGILSRTGLLPNRLELEVTETAWMEECEECSTNFRALRAAGIGIALDDFGTGFSTFGRLHETEVDHIKIDKSFVEGLGADRGDEAIIQAIVELARAKGLKTTAEGVETEAQMEFLKRVGCDELQGFLYSEPLSGEEVDRLLAGRPDRRLPRLSIV